MRIALGLEYDGSRFHGWQTQPGGGTVQDALQGALATIAAAPVGVTCAGRTDRGVHARMQVVHFDAPAARPDTAWVRGTNALLPEAIAVLWAVPVAADFHARYCARSRTYRYLLLARPVRPAIGARFAGWTHARPDVQAMHEAAAFLLGEHDFSAFRSAECQARSPVRTLHALDICAENDRLQFVLRANAFLHHMVRNIVGALIHVGLRKREPRWMRELLEGRDRALAAPTAPPEGLYLEAIEYEPRWGLPPSGGAPRAALPGP
jgi:tRNA pseudouridine38-40 synthase